MINIKCSEGPVKRGDTVAIINDHQVLGGDSLGNHLWEAIKDEEHGLVHMTPIGNSSSTAQIFAVRKDWLARVELSGDVEDQRDPSANDSADGHSEKF
ncbi:MAG: hypothetical protein EPN79_10730 [Burkholderiaceae bacterium]|nr:MAG: hypothetical protein EPN79_10730 [Burkholderiaceae bacterium]TBR76838.1 MAG: hypothetical protein EPN64_06345 [Burkholderiaceae bacterium]